jgi:hypothetical protein
MALGDLHAGVDPATVLPAAMAAVRELTAVEAGEVGVRRGIALVTVRFEESDDLAASMVGRAVVDRVDRLVVVESSRVTRRWGARWEPLR